MSTSAAPKRIYSVRRLIGIAFIFSATGAQASHWVPVATGPDADPTGLYVDKDSIKGGLQIRTILEKFVNSYREQQLSLVEMNCIHKTWRTIKHTSLSPSGLILKRAELPNAKHNPIASNSPQETVRRLVCKIGKVEAAAKHAPVRR